jgi:hypothetical protein
MLVRQPVPSHRAIMVSPARPATNESPSPPTGYPKFQVTGNILRRRHQVKLASGFGARLAGATPVTGSLVSFHFRFGEPTRLKIPASRLNSLTKRPLDHQRKLFSPHRVVVPRAPLDHYDIRSRIARWVWSITSAYSGSGFALSQPPDVIAIAPTPA